MQQSLLLLCFHARFVLGIVNFYIDIDNPSPCRSIIDCFSSPNPNDVCYEGYCVACRQSGESCSGSSHCCSGARCYRRRCTILYETGHSCRLNRQCLDPNDFCIDRVCKPCTPLWSPCSSSSSPCCTGTSICRNRICRPARRHWQTCQHTFDCSDDLICLSGICQNPLGYCDNDNKKK